MVKRSNDHHHNHDDLAFMNAVPARSEITNQLADHVGAYLERSELQIEVPVLFNELVCGQRRKVPN